MKIRLGVSGLVDKGRSPVVSGSVLKPQRSRSPHYQARRADLLHKLCKGIVQARSRGVSRLESIRRACLVFSRSTLARERGVEMGLSTMRSHFSIWKKNPSASAFQRKAAKRDQRIIPQEAVPALEEYAIREHISVAELHRRLVRDNPDRSLSYATLCRAIGAQPVIRCVRGYFSRATNNKKIRLKPPLKLSQLTR